MPRNATVQFLGFTTLLLLQQALREYIFIQFVSTAKSITFKREGIFVDPITGIPDDRVAGSTPARTDYANYTITIYDFAWKAKPDGVPENLFTLPTADYFKASIAHELTHVAVSETTDPATGQSWLLNSWRQRGGGMGYPISPRYDAEDRLAIAVANYNYGCDFINTCQEVSDTNRSWIESLRYYALWQSLWDWVKTQR